jgi:hypothetical protein
MISRQAFKQALKLHWSHALQVLVQSWHNIWRIVSELPTGNAFIFLMCLNNLHPRGLSLFIADRDAAVPHPAMNDAAPSSPRRDDWCQRGPPPSTPSSPLTRREPGNDDRLSYAEHRLSMSSYVRGTPYAEHCGMMPMTTLLRYQPV